MIVAEPKVFLIKTANKTDYATDKARLKYHIMTALDSLEAENSRR